MNLETTLKKINNGREKVEACFVFSCWKDPELYEEYKTVNAGKDETLQDPDAQFYWLLGQTMYNQGIKKFDHISLEAFLLKNKKIKKKFEEYGGYETIQKLEALIDSQNVEGYFDKISRMNSLSEMAKKSEELFNNVERFDNATNEDIYDVFELLNNSISLKTGHEAKIEKLKVTKEFIEKNQSGENVGLNYSENTPLLNYITLGMPLGDVYLFAAHSGAGKTSFIFENMILPISKHTPVAILSNEMKIDAYQNMLSAHILTKDLDYWNMTRKKIKIGKYTDDDMDKWDDVVQLSDEKYSNIYFVKIFANDTNMICKYIKKLAHMGVRYIVWDTMKGDDITDGSDAWLQLLMNSRKIFNLVSKLNIALTCTFQLALYTTNQRYLDASCLSSSKQIKEVVSELIMMRKLWSDEYTGEKKDCKVFKFDKDNKKIKKMITLDPEKTYYVCFVNKTRNDEGDCQILYEWKSAWNRWYEIGYCNIVNDHKGSG